MGVAGLVEIENIVGMSFLTIAFAFLIHKKKNCKNKKVTKMNVFLFEVED